jgi:hypothetical protein
MHGNLSPLPMWLCGFKHKRNFVFIYRESNYRPTNCELRKQKEAVIQNLGYSPLASFVNSQKKSGKTFGDPIPESRLSQSRCSDTYVASRVKATWCTGNAAESRNN